ncbi:sigma 54-interacting transcriptional regulator [Desulfobacterales bacterium HSG16]|nr:sigma 54-interacting transcriptional regulator [Desulfobacterales bacterium HSG16]
MKSVKQDKSSRDVTEIILESISDGVFTVDHHWRIMSFNRAAEEITGISRKEAVGRHCWDVFRSNMCEGDCALRRTMEGGKSLVNTSTYVVNSKKEKIPIIASTSLLRDEKGNVLGGVEIFRDLSLVEELRKELDSRFQMGDMISRSQGMQKIFRILPQVAESDSTVLIQGETGTGKELLARAVHEFSFRKDKPFVAINCGALPDTLLESELFGYKAGAFTNAVKDKPGHFAAAEGGTLFLDEIGDISPAFQVRLLRVLEDRKYKPLGGIEEVSANVRIIAAANKDLAAMVKEDKFRQDLFYRINVVGLTLPPLRERKEDIPMLIENTVSRINRLRDRAVNGVDHETLAVLIAHDYPGNIRELENIIEHAFVLCGNGIIQPSHLPGNLAPSTSVSNVNEADKKSDDSLKDAEKRAIMDALKRNDYNRLAAARELGIHKSTLFRKIKKLEIILPEIDGRSSRTQS